MRPFAYWNQIPIPGSFQDWNMLIVPDHPAAPIDPHLPAQYAAALGAGQVKPPIDGFPKSPSHDLS
jgi:hypothetical protein